MDRRTLLKAGLTAPAAVLAGTALASPADALATPRVRRTLARGLDFPWGIDFLPGGAALVTERNSGRVLRVRPGGGFSVVGQIDSAFNNGGEGGLMGLALSPDFASDQLVYMFVTTRNDNRIIRATFDGTSLGTPEPILTGIPRALRHNGGGLWFSHKGSLFATTGDTTNRALSQNKGSLAGKVLRLRRNGTAHPGNPFGSRVYTYGHRNPEGITQSDDGRLWISELGENTWDEMNLLSPGANYGWPRAEGSDGPGGFRNPFTQWHPENASPSGIACSHGSAWVGTLRGQSLWQVDISGANARTRRRHFHGTFGRIRMVKRAPDSSLWIGTSNGGGADRIVRITVS